MLDVNLSYDSNLLIFFSEEYVKSHFSTKHKPSLTEMGKKQFSYIFHFFLIPGNIHKWTLNIRIAIVYFISEMIGSCRNLILIEFYI